MAPESRDIVDGGRYFLPCVAFSKQGRAVSITWSVDGKLIGRESSKLSVIERNRTQNDVFLQRSVLELKCASFADALEYTCTATDGIKTSQESFTLRHTCERVL